MGKDSLTNLILHSFINTSLWCSRKSVYGTMKVTVPQICHIDYSNLPTANDVST